MDVNFFEPMEEKTMTKSTGEKVTGVPMKDKNGNELKDKNGDQILIASTASQLRSIIAKWYTNLRNIAVVVLLSILLYIGIRIVISSTSNDKAKYKQMIIDWVVAICLLFVMHYIMSFANVIIDKITNIVLVNRAYEDTYAAIIPNDDKDKIFSTLKDEYDYDIDSIKVDDDHIIWVTNLLGQIRVAAQMSQDVASTYAGYAILFVIAVLFTIFFIFTYIKRVLYMAFLTLIAPLVALTYPIDKLNDGQAQAFNTWLKEYIFNLLIQPLHLLLYTIFVSSAFELAGKNVIYALLAIGFMIPAEKLMRKFFGFEKAHTPGLLAGPAGAAMTMAGLNKLLNHGPRGGQSDRNGSSGDKDDSRVKVKDSLDTDAYLMGNNGQRSLPGGNQSGDNSSQQDGSNNPPLNGGDDSNDQQGGGSESGQGNPPGVGAGAGQGNPPAVGVGADQGNPPEVGAGSDQGNLPGVGAGTDQGNPPGVGAGTDQGNPPEMGARADQGNPPEMGARADQGNPPEMGAGAGQRNPPEMGSGAGQGNPPEIPRRMYTEDRISNWWRNTRAAHAMSSAKRGIKNKSRRIIKGVKDIAKKGVEKGEKVPVVKYPIKLGKALQNTRLWNATKAAKRYYARGLANKISRKISDPHLGRKAIRMAGGAFVGAAAATTGLAVGVASGDPRNALQYTTAAALGGYKLGSGTVNSASNALSVEGTGDEFSRNYYGEDEYKERQIQANIKKAKEDNEMITTLEKKLGSREKAQEAMGTTMETAIRYGIDDPNAVAALYQMEHGSDGQPPVPLMQAISALQLSEKYNKGAHTKFIGQKKRDDLYASLKQRFMKKTNNNEEESEGFAKNTMDLMDRVNDLRFKQVP